MRPPVRSVDLRNVTVLVAALAVTGAFAGCVGGAADPAIAEPEVPMGTGSDGKPIVTGDWAPFKFDLPPTYESEWENGTFKLQENNFPLGVVWWNAGMGEQNLRTIDLTDKVPKNVPVRLVASVDAQVANGGDVDIWFDVPFDEVWSGTWDTPFGGKSEIEIRIVHKSDAPIRAVLAYGEYDQSAEFAYSWNVQVIAEPEALLEGVAAAFEVPEGGATLGVDLLVPGRTPAVLLWDPADNFLGRFPVTGGRFERPLTESGEYLIMLAGGSGHGRFGLKDVEETSVMRPIDQEIVQHEMTAPGPSVEWTFTADRVPIQAAFYAISGSVASDFTGSLQGPDGKLFDVAFSGGPWVRPVTGFGTFEWTDMGGPGLDAGTYTAKAAFAQSFGPDPMVYGDYLVFLQR